MITIAILFIAFIALFFITTVIHEENARLENILKNSYIQRDIMHLNTLIEEEKENHRLALIELNDINDRIDDIKDDVEWYSQPAIVRDNYECEPKVRATGKKWDADTLARKEKNMKAKNSKAKGNFKPWQH